MSEQDQMMHHHLITGEIVFTVKGDKSEQVNAVRVNGVIVDPDKELPVRLLGKSQQILQLNFHQRMQDENIQVVDVVILNLAYLGHMTQEDFNRTPEGTKIQEKTDTAAEV